jgi:hypothetical protein
MGRERARRAAELAQVLAGRHLFGDALQAVHEHGELLAHRGRRRRLAVRVREHGGIPHLERA